MVVPISCKENQKSMVRNTLKKRSELWKSTSIDRRNDDINGELTDILITQTVWETK